MAALSKFTPSVTSVFLAAKANGKSHTEAACMAGVTRRQVYNWIARGAMGQEPYASFVREIAKAEKRWMQDQLSSFRQAYAA